MNKTIYIGLVIFFVFLSVGTTIGIYSRQKNSYQEKIIAAQAETNEKNSASTALKNDKDANEYLPSDVVKNFMNEVKNDSPAKAKLYLTTANQSLDLKTALKVDDLLIINTVDASYTIDGEEATVIYNGFLKAEDNIFSRKFTLVKENDAWKISKIEEN